MRRIQRPVLLVLLACAVALTLLCYIRSSPHDRTDTSFINVPADTQFLCVISSDLDRQPQAMQWYRTAHGPSEKAPPADPAFSSPSVVAGRVEHLQVAWLYGRRYGVVTLGGDGNWRITWFSRDVVSMDGRGFNTFPNPVTFDLSQGRQEPLSDADVAALGLRSKGGQE
jgi:hypothetical protein